MESRAHSSKFLPTITGFLLKKTLFHINCRIELECECNTSGSINGSTRRNREAYRKIWDVL